MSKTPKNIKIPQRIRKPEVESEVWNLAIAWADKHYLGDQMRHCARIAFCTGYEAGSKTTEKEIADIIVDIRKKETEERNKLPPLLEQRCNRIWEKIKVKIIGVF